MPSPLRDAPPKTSRWQAAKLLLSPAQLRESWRLQPAIALRNSLLVGAQSSFALVIGFGAAQVFDMGPLSGFAALGALVPLFARFAPSDARMQALTRAAFAFGLAVLVMSLAAWLEVPRTARFMLLTLLCGVFSYLAASWKLGAPGPVLFVFAASAANSVGTTGSDVVARTAIILAVGLFSVAVCALSERWRIPPSPSNPLPQEPKPDRKQRFISALRLSFAAGLSLWIVDLLGGQYPSWAALGAVATLQAREMTQHMSRALQRIIGNIIGVGIAWLIFQNMPDLLGLLVLLVVLQMLIEAIIGFNYAIGQMLVTPFALIMIVLVVPVSDNSQILPERVFDTILGAAIAVVVGLLMSLPHERRNLARHHKSD